MLEADMLILRTLANWSAIRFLDLAVCPVDDAGEFCFKTIKPGSVSGADGVKQAPHLEVSLFMRGLLRRLITRIYFPEEPGNDSDAVLAQVPIARRHTLIARPDAEDGNTLLWDVHLQGDKETVFFDY